jgi:hypothetical protein
MNLFTGIRSFCAEQSGLKRKAVLCGVSVFLWCAPTSGLRAFQQLLSSPFPLNSGINSMDTPVVVPHYHQHLLPDAAPAANGPNAWGNPPRIHRYGRQRLVPSPYPREYWER